MADFAENTAVRGRQERETHASLLAKHEDLFPVGKLNLNYIRRSLENITRIST